MKKLIAALAVFAVVFGVSASATQASTWQARTVMTLGDTMVMPSNYPTGCAGNLYHTRTIGLLNAAKDKLLCAKSNSAYLSSTADLRSMGYVYLGTTADMKHIWKKPFNGTKKTVIVPANLIPAYASMGYQSIAVVGFDLDM